MGLLIFLIAILSLAFPPVGVIALAVVILGVFTKGVAAASQEQMLTFRWKAGHRHRAKRPRRKAS